MTRYTIINTILGVIFLATVLCVLPFGEQPSAVMLVVEWLDR